MILPLGNVLDKADTAAKLSPKKYMVIFLMFANYLPPRLTAATEINFWKILKNPLKGGMQFLKITEFFEELEIEREYSGYFYSVATGITIVIPGTICGLRNIHQIWVWASNERVVSEIFRTFFIKSK